MCTDIFSADCLVVLGMAGLQHLRSVPVEHCYDAYGVVITSHQGWRIVYSADTRPSKSLTRAGQGATLLIHEATFQADLQEEVRNNNNNKTYRRYASFHSSLLYYIIISSRPTGGTQASFLIVLFCFLFLVSFSLGFSPIWRNPAASLPPFAPCVAILDC